MGSQTHGFFSVPKIYGKDVNEAGLGPRFEGVIRRACEKTSRRVVILVDEYDKPMLQAIGNPELQEAYRSTLKGFYGALKSMDAYIRFAILTGVSKFPRISMESYLNNLNDISMNAAYADICGFNEKELLTNFKYEISALASTNGMSEEECSGTMRIRYGGFHFGNNSIEVYNPFSVLNAFGQMMFDSYWFKAEDPSYLIPFLNSGKYNFEALLHVRVISDVLNSVHFDSLYPIPILFQSGYLTIKGYDPRFKTYTLGFPNEEVEEGFVNFSKETRNIDEVLVG